MSFIVPSTVKCSSEELMSAYETAGVHTFMQSHFSERNLCEWIILSDCESVHFWSVCEDAVLRGM